MLYHNNIVNYLVVPEKAEIPAGLEKDCVIINQPVEASYIASEPVLGRLVEMGLLDSVSDISIAEEAVKIVFTVFGALFVFKNNARMAQNFQILIVFFGIF